MVLPIEMELRYINLSDIYPTGIFTPLEVRVKYQWLIVHSELPPIKFISVGDSLSTYHLDYKPESIFTLDSSNGVFSHGITPEEAVSNLNV